MKDETYNGWTNYETWCVNLWMNNSEGDQEFLFDLAKESHYRPSVMADSLKETLEELKPEIKNGMYSDLLNAALGSVNWFEIAKSVCDEEKPEEEGDAA